MHTLTTLSAQLDAALTEFKKLDLGSKPGEYGGLCGPSAEMPKVYYPSIYLPDSEDDFDLPEKGTAVVEYKVTRKSVETRNGKTRHSATLDVISIEPETLRPGDRETKSKKGQVAKLLSVPSPCLNHFGYGERTRNGNGQFIANETGGADPTSMRQAYAPRRQPQPEQPAQQPQIVVNNAPPSRLKPGMVGAALGAGAMTKRGKRLARVAGSSVMRGARAMTGLDAKLDALLEFARGDYAMPYMKDRGLVPPESSKEGFNAAMRKNVKEHRSKYNSWMGDNLTAGQASKQVQSYRDTAARGIKTMRKDDVRKGLRNPLSRAEIAEGRAMQKYINKALAAK